MLSIIFYSFRCEIRVTLMLLCSSSSVLIFYLIYPHPLISFLDYPVISTFDCSIGVIYRITKVAFSRVVTVGIRAEGLVIYLGYVAWSW